MPELVQVVLMLLAYTVNANGVVTTKKAGKVTITATSNGDKTKFDSIEITVSAATVPVTSVTVESTRAAVLLSLANFLLFFGGDFFRTVKQEIKYHKTRRTWQNQNRSNWR